MNYSRDNGRSAPRAVPRRCGGLLLVLTCVAAWSWRPPGAAAAEVAETGVPVDGIAAQVNGETVTIGDVYGGVRALLNDPQWLGGRDRKEAFRAAFAEALDQLIHQRLIVQEYRSGKARLPEWLIEKRQTEILDNRFRGDRAALLRELARERMTQEDWHRRIEEQMIVAAMRQSQVQSNVRIAPGQILEAYRANLDRYRQPAGVRLGLILLKARPGEDEEGLLARARAVAGRCERGETFEAVAREVSEDASAAQGGDWGWVAPEETLREELVAALAALPPGKVSAPVLTSAGCYLLRKVEERPAGVRPLEEVREEIERSLAEAESERLLQAWMQRLRDKSTIRIYMDHPASGGALDLPEP